MDRPIVYIGAIPLDTNFLQLAKNAMVSDGWLAQTMVGTSTAFLGLACSPTGPAGMTVNIGPGLVYAQQNIDNSAYGSLNSDTSDQIVKIGINQSTLNFPCPAPATLGQSVVYLIEAAFLEEDTGPVVLPYYNAANPAMPWAGPNNTGVSQNTTRQNICSVQVKAGVPATTGTQVTPTPDVGYTGLWAVTVANGQTTITSGSIAQVSGAPFITETLLQKISQATADARYAQITTAQNNGYDFAVDTSGTVNAIVAALSPVPASLIQGIDVTVTVANSNTGPTTLNLNGFGAKSVTKNGNALSGGEMVAGHNYCFSYNGASWDLQTPPANSTLVYTGSASTTGSANAQVLAAVTPSGLTLQYGDIVTFTAGITNTGATTINVASTGAVTIKKKNSGGGLVDLAAGDLTSTDVYQIIYDGTFWELNSQSFPPASTFFQVANQLSEGIPASMRASLGLAALAILGAGAGLVSSGGNLNAVNTRTTLTGNTTFYVSTSGSDSNTGLSSGQAWQTLQHAINTLAAQYDLAGFNATIQLADGTYSAGAQISAAWVGGGGANVVINGNSVTPSNVILSPASGSIISATGSGCGIQIQNLKLASTGTSQGLVAANGATISCGPGIVFGTCGNGSDISAHITAVRNAQIIMASNYSIVGGSGWHFIADTGGQINADGVTITLTGTPNFNKQFANASDCAAIHINAPATFTGSATGVRYLVNLNGVILTGGSGPSYLPGNSAGSTATGGQYG